MCDKGACWPEQFALYTFQLLGHASLPSGALTSKASTVCTPLLHSAIHAGGTSLYCVWWHNTTCTSLNNTLSVQENPFCSTDALNDLTQRVQQQ